MINIKTILKIDAERLLNPAAREFVKDVQDKYKYNEVNEVNTDYAN